jgi:hypothetical protein
MENYQRKVKIQDTEINNWAEFIKCFFSDANYFEINEGLDGEIKVTSKTNGTYIYFYLSPDSMTLFDCQYYNVKCKGWSGETTGANDKCGIFNQDNVDSIIDVLSTPVDKGWIAIDYYLGDYLIKCKTYFDKDRNKTPFVDLQNDFGIWSIVLFPLYVILERLVHFGVIGRQKEIIIDSIKK